MKLSTRTQELSPSMTLSISSRSKELQKEGQDIVALGVGEPDFNTPQHILEAAKRAMDEGKTKYTPSGGIKELKEAVRNKFIRENNLQYRDDQITVTSGAKQALYNVFQAILNPGDEVIVPAPYWVSYIEQIKLAGGIPVIVDCDESDNFKLRASKLHSAITNKTKALLINSPSNPTGVMYSKEELSALGEVCTKENLIIISDEIYEHLLYGEEKHVSIASLSDDLYSRTVIINGVSKTYSMTGWRIGYACGPEMIIQAMTHLASHSTSNPTSISQYAAIAALGGPEEPINKMRAAFKERRDYVLDRLEKMPDLSCEKPLGAFYVYVNIKNSLKALGYADCNEWSQDLLEKERVAVIPGSAFGSKYHVRISYASSIDQLEKAMDRIQRFTQFRGLN